MAVRVKEKSKGSGEWWIFINHKGRRRSKKIGDKHTANAVAKEVRQQLAKGDLGMFRPECPTVAQYGSEWLKSPLIEWTDGTLENYVSVFNLYIKKHFGNKKLNEIKRKHIKKFIGGIERATSTKRTILSVLSGILDSALDDELISSNPCNGTQKFCGKAIRKKVDPLSADEVQIMLGNASWLEFVYYAFYFVAVRTGLRLGELLGLKWKDVNLEKRHLTVKRSFYYKTKSWNPPKNKKTRRVDLTPATVEVLKELQSRRKLVSLKGDDLVFTLTGEPLSYSQLWEKFKAVTPRSVRIHDLRHTYATLRIAKNDNLLDVSRQLGHHSVAFTLDRYAHWVPGECKGQVDELDSLHLSAPQAHPRGVN